MLIEFWRKSLVAKAPERAVDAGFRDVIVLDLYGTAQGKKGLWVADAYYLSHISHRSSLLFG